MTRTIWIGGVLVVCAGVALGLGLGDRAQPVVDGAKDVAETAQAVAVPVSLSDADPVVETSHEPAQTRAASTQTASAPALPSPLVPYEQRLGRPIVFFAEGTLGANFFANLRDLDATVQAFDYDTQPQSLADIDVYMLKAPTVADMRGRSDHALHDRIVAELEGQSDTQSFTWFSVGVSKSGQEDTRDVIVILANDYGLTNLSEFCLNVYIYEMVRFAHDTTAFQAAQNDGALMFNACERNGWTSVADMDERR